MSEKREEIEIENVIRIMLSDLIRKELIQEIDKININNYYSDLSFLLDLLI